MTLLNAAHPLVLDARPLGRRAGAMARVRRTFPAPAGWEVSSARVPPGSPVELQVRLEAVVEGVLVTGTASAAIEGECSRCLEQVHQAFEVQLQQLFEYPDQQHALPREDVEEDPLPALQGDLLDLEPVVRDGVVLDLPLAPLCAADCPGLCPSCGTALADNPDHRHREPDDRWAALHDWLQIEGPATRAGPDRTDEKDD